MFTDEKSETLNEQITQNCSAGKGPQNPHLHPLPLVTITESAPVSDID